VVLKWSGAQPSELWALLPIAPLKYPWSGRRLLQSLPAVAGKERTTKRPVPDDPSGPQLQLLRSSFPSPSSSPRSFCGRGQGAASALRTLPAHQYCTVETSPDTTPSHPQSHILQPSRPSFSAHLASTPTFSHTSQLILHCCLLLLRSQL
jgi:hypothetical protein